MLKPLGALIRADAAAFREKLEIARAESFGRIVVDASAIPYIDSEGLEMLVEVSETLAESGLALKLCGLNETLREVLDLTELLTLFEYFEDINSAVRSYL